MLCLSMFTLSQAIFSDDSEDEEENTPGSNQVEDTQKKIEAANTALNRLMAGDFLESLGKELGLAVPPELPLSENKAGPKVSQKETNPWPEKSSGTTHNVTGSSRNEEMTGKVTNDHQNSQGGRNTLVHIQDGGKIAGRMSGNGSNDDRSSKDPQEKSLNTCIIQKHSKSSNSSSEDERSVKHSSRRHKSSSDSDSDTSSDSDDYRDRHRSRSRRKEKRTHGEKSRSKKHSKYHHSKHRRKNASPSRSHRSSGKEHNDHKRKKNK